MYAHESASYSCFPQVLAITEPATMAMHEEGVALGPWHVPKGYRVRSGAQLD